MANDPMPALNCLIDMRLRARLIFKRELAKSLTKEERGNWLKWYRNSETELSNLRSVKRQIEGLRGIVPTLRKIVEGLK